MMKTFGNRTKKVKQNQYYVFMNSEKNSKLHKRLKSKLENNYINY